MLAILYIRRNYQRVYIFYFVDVVCVYVYISYVYVMYKSIKSKSLRVYFCFAHTSYVSCVQKAHIDRETRHTTKQCWMR